jgi:rSAM/selenodomain-associated transferase 2
MAVIVPVVGDQDALADLLERLRGWKTGPREIIVVSGSPSAELRELCRHHASRYIETAANRGAQLDCGAHATQADVLWFLHADAWIPVDAMSAIRSALEGGAEGGYFRFGFAGRPRPVKRLLALLINLRTRCGGIPYADQGIFVRRDAYMDCGGFLHEPLFEEVALIRRLRRRGQFREVALRIGVSPRRWERDGWWRRSLHNRWLALRYICGASPRRLSLAYNRQGRDNGDAPG